MRGMKPRLLPLVLALTVLLTVTVGGIAQADQADQLEENRASWLMERTGLEDLALTGQRFEQGEIGGDGGGASEIDPDTIGPKDGKKGGALPILFSLILPGSGEAYMGYKRGYFMMAADILAWTQVAKYNNQGDELKQDYLDFADAHYRDEWLVNAYNNSDDNLDDARRGSGIEYFPEYGPIFTVEDLDDPEVGLPLYVSKEDDFREYYENLGKWDQFVMGWDDYLRPDDPFNWPEGSDGPTGENSDLRQPWVSKNRETYRLMRDESNDAYETRDTWLYVNIGLRVFSVIQSAYLGGVLGGDVDKEMAIGDHKIDIIAQPVGWKRGVMAATVTF